jgi:hypothetical protein
MHTYFTLEKGSIDRIQKTELGRYFSIMSLRQGCSRSMERILVAVACPPEIVPV